MRPSAGAATLSCTLTSRDNDPVLFDLNYRRFVDEKLRNDGVTATLRSRGMEPPQEARDNNPGVQSVRALSNLKDKYLLERLKQRGIDSHEAAITLVRALQAHTTRVVPLHDEVAERVIPGREPR